VAQLQPPRGLTPTGRAAWRHARDVLDALGERPELSAGALCRYAHAVDVAARLRFTPRGDELVVRGPRGEVYPCFDPTQRSIARVLMALDRGVYVRHPAAYVRLIDLHLEEVTSEIWTDVYRFPYTHMVTSSHR
jgi:hypothetical protein